MTVDAIRRAQLRAHHSATHLLHEALRRHLGTHVTQKGSLVAPDRLRFDISHTKPISAEELRKVEDEVNARIRLNSSVDTRLMTPEEAIAAGAMALFGEKYGEEVRVLSMGGADGEKYSVELCGGTHALRTGDIGLFQHRRRGRGVVRRAPHRGGRGQRGRSACPPSDRPAERGGVGHEGAAGRSAGRACRRWSTASARSSASSPRRARRWRWPAAAAAGAANAADEMREVGRHQDDRRAC